MSISPTAGQNPVMRLDFHPRRPAGLPTLSCAAEDRLVQHRPALRPRLTTREIQVEALRANLLKQGAILDLLKG